MVLSDGIPRARPVYERWMYEASVGLGSSQQRSSVGEVSRLGARPGDGQAVQGARR